MSLNVTSGDNAALEVTVSGSPELKIKWFKDNKDLSAGGSKQLHFEVVLSAILKVITVIVTMSIILIGDCQRNLNHEMNHLFLKLC